MSKQFGALDIPPAALADPEAKEIARIWATSGKQEVCLRTAVWKDPAAWGLMLVDLARHIARSYEQIDGRDPNEVLARIREGFDADWPREFNTTTGSVE